MTVAVGRHVALPATALLLAACGKLLAIDDVGYSTVDAATEDASSGAETGADTGADGPTSDVATGEEASLDASRLRFCERDAGPGLIVCDDFDGLDFAAWTGRTAGAGPLVRDDAGFFSPPSSLLALPPPDAGDKASVLSMSIPVGAAGVILEAEVLTEVVGGSDIDLLQIQVTQGGVVSQAGLTFFGGQWKLERQDALGYDTKTTSVTFDTWKRVRMEWTFVVGSGDGSVTLSVNDAPVVIEPFTRRVPAALTVLVGVPYFKGGGSPWRIRFDDVIVRVK